MTIQIKNSMNEDKPVKIGRDGQLIEVRFLDTVEMVVECKVIVVRCEPDSVCARCS